MTHSFVTGSLVDSNRKENMPKVGATQGAGGKIDAVRIHQPAKGRKHVASGNG